MSEQGLVGVVGTGTMGRGIIQLFAQSGHQVLFYDAVESAAVQACDFIGGMIQKVADKGRITQQQADAIRTRLVPCQHLAELRSCRLVIEAVFENLDLKRQLFSALEEIVDDNAILASNTSSFLIAEIAALCRRPQRVVGAHFFNPVPLMSVVEIIPGVHTDGEVVTELASLLGSTGHRAVIVQDQPGFLINHIGRGLYTEGLRLLEERVATAGQIDELLRDAAGFRMGPFELLDLTGLDVSGKVMSSIYDQFHQEPRFRPSTLLPPRIAARLLGRKSGAGWYRYENGKKLDSEPARVPLLDRSIEVWVDPTADDVDALNALCRQAGLNLAAQPNGQSLHIFQPWGLDVTRASVGAGLDPSRSVAVDPLPGLDRRRTLMLSVSTRPEYRDAAHALLAQGGHAVTLIGDSPGYVVQRVLATIINIAANLAQRGIASVEDIEAAVPKGLGYPSGPLAWGDRIGAARVLRILEAQQMLTGDMRYRPSLWLRRRSEAGLSLQAEEAGR